MNSDLMAQIHAKKALDASPAVQDALDQCTEDDVPILKLLRNACPVGMHGYGCETRWDVHDSFLPRPRRWLKQYNASRVRAAASAGVDSSPPPQQNVRQAGHHQQRREGHQE